MPIFPETSSDSVPVQNNFFRKIKRFLTSFFCLLGLFVFLTALARFCMSPGKDPAVFAPGTVLKMNLSSGLYESRPTDLIGSITFGNAPTVADVVLGLYRAAKDPNIETLVAYMTNTELSLSQAQEIREAVKAFRNAGKKTVFYAPTFGELGGGMTLYYLATAFEEIRMQPSGEVGLAGISVETPYFKKALLKWGITPSFEARYEYKSGADSLNEEEMSAAERTNLLEILDDMLTVIAEQTGADRGIDPDKMKNILKDGPYFADQALKAGLIDKTEYPDVLETELKKKSGEKENELVDIFDYVAETSPEIKSNTPVIAYVPAVGVIQFGESVFGGDSYRSILGNSSFSSMLREAADDKNVKAVVIRLDSPGGGYAPSDAIRREIEYVKEQSGKPVVCSMGGTAASGGYFISLGCDRVLADQATLTGSIGVFGGKLVFKDLLEKLDINVSSLKIGKNAGLFSMASDFSEEQKRFFNQALDRVYTDFTAKVAARRNFSPQKTNDVARGRVFTGKQAAEVGLIDGIGGLYASFGAAAEMARLPEPFFVVEYPVAPTRLELLLQLLDSEMGVSLRKSVFNNGALPAVKSWLTRLTGGDFTLFYGGLPSF